MGFWGWGMNLHYLSLAKIDVPSLIRYPSRQSPQQAPHHTSTYHLATLFSIPLVISLLLFWTITRGSAELVKSWEILPQSYLFLFVVLLLLPFHRLSRAGRQRFRIALQRISLGGLAEAQDGKFGDILLADALTSYSKVLAELFVSLCMFFSHDVSSTGKPNRHCGGGLVVPLIVAIPSMIRLRQCLIEFGRVRRTGSRNDGWGGQHLANALKYATAFPVIIFTALEWNYDLKGAGSLSEVTVSRLWVLFCFINSSYSLYWDITKDWDLNLFSADRNSPEYPFGLRQYRCFYNSNIYYGAIVVDLILRFTWLTRLSPRLDKINNTESGIFVLMLLEVARRWMWIFLRVETEWVRSNRGPAPDDILLGEFNGKLDDD